MNKVKNVFTIKDLENLSGIKAHTIRMWEKRYAILEPMRTETNIRTYNLENLQKLLNIVLLHNFGYKISKIATLTKEKFQSAITQIAAKQNTNDYAVNEFKIAMFNFDEKHFLKTYNWLGERETFSEIFVRVFIPLLHELGILWHTNNITIAHEHFISCLIKQKIAWNTEMALLKSDTKYQKTFVLSLPTNEFHEIGLLYLNYEIITNGYKTVYLGENMPIANLKLLKKHFQDIIYISYLTVEPNKDNAKGYIDKMKQELLDNSTKLWFIGQLLQQMPQIEKDPRISFFNSTQELINTISNS